METIIFDLKPDVIGIVETKISSKIQLKIRGYQIYKKCKTSLSGGLMIAIRNEYAKQIVETTIVDSDRIMTLLITSKTSIFRFILVYGPQENDANDPGNM